jgi:hypothetical protein
LVRWNLFLFLLEGKELLPVHSNEAPALRLLQLILDEKRHELRHRYAHPLAIRLEYSVNLIRKMDYLLPFHLEPHCAAFSSFKGSLITFTQRMKDLTSSY